MTNPAASINKTNVPTPIVHNIFIVVSDKTVSVVGGDLLMIPELTKISFLKFYYGSPYHILSDWWQFAQKA
jgi:hypothetical protein